jgi:hypothetical protein
MERAIRAAPAILSQRGVDNEDENASDVMSVLLERKVTS